nr:polyprotein [Theobroma cacao]
MIIFTDPGTGTTRAQELAYMDLERLSCNSPKDIFQYMNDYKVLAAKSGRMWIGTELSDKFFRKMPQMFGTELEKAYNTAYPGNTVGVLPRIYFAYQYLAELCKKAAFQRSLKDLQFCKEVHIPGYYEKKKYGLRKSTTYKGKPHQSHVRIFKKKDSKYQSKCKCFICGMEGHFAAQCTRKKGDIARVAMLDNMELPAEWDVLSVNLDESDSDAIVSVVEEESGNPSHLLHLQELPYEQDSFPDFTTKATIFMMIDQTSQPRWRPHIILPPAMQNCTHEYPQINQEVPLQFINCQFCRVRTERSRFHCSECKLTSCLLCCEFELQRSFPNAPPLPTTFSGKDKLIAELSSYVTHLANEVERLTKENELLRQDILLSEEVLDDQRIELDRKNKGKAHEIPEAQSFEFPTSSSQKPLIDTQEMRKAIGLIQEDRISILTEVARSAQHGQVIKNSLFNFNLTIHIHGLQKTYPVRAILDTGASKCCVDPKAIDNEAIEKCLWPVEIKGINSISKAEYKLKAGYFEINNNKFPTAFTYVFPMGMTDGVHMLVGANFVRSIQGGLRIEGSQLTFYKKITSIETADNNPVVRKANVEEENNGHGNNGLEDEEITVEVQLLLWASPTAPAIKGHFYKKYLDTIQQLKAQGIIGTDPQRYWSKNKIHYELELINPDITIQDRPLKHVTPKMEEQFRRHVKALLELGVIRPSTSRHRTIAIMMESGTEYDSSGKQIHGKERMVFNYKTLNENTYKDQYSLPGINTILQRIGNAKIFSKFDLKSGFHQIKMKESSIPWTAFWVPDGLYEWLVMPFGLKNAPAAFQRKMDNCFKGTDAFIAVYIDDILVFSNSEAEHNSHLQQMLSICQENGLILSPTKMKIAQPEIEFLGAIIGNSRIKLQPHIIKKIADFPDDQMKTKKGLRSWLGILNYSRAYVPKLGTLFGPLYEKTSPHGDKRLSASDWNLIRQIKAKVKNLPDMRIPPPDAYIVLEVDGCMDGWGGICKWKPAKGALRSEENVCAYVSGKFPVPKATIDAEIHACMNTLEKLKIYYLDKKEITLRTDCQAIISFYSKSALHKPSRVRWIAFTDFLTGTGVTINIEHIDGKLNTLADHLSRIVANCITTECLDDELLQVLNASLQEIAAIKEETPKQQEILKSLLDHLEPILWQAYGVSTESEWKNEENGILATPTIQTPSQKILRSWLIQSSTTDSKSKPSSRITSSRSRMNWQASPSYSSLPKTFSKEASP